MKDAVVADLCRKWLLVYDAAIAASVATGYQAHRQFSHLYEGLCNQAPSLAPEAAARGVDHRPLSSLPPRHGPPKGCTPAEKAAIDSAAETIRALLDALDIHESSNSAATLALNWLLARLIEAGEGAGLVPKERFHDYLLSIGAPVNETVGACRNRGWIEDALIGQSTSHGPGGTFSAEALQSLAAPMRVPSIPGYRILPAVRSASALYMDRPKSHVPAGWCFNSDPPSTLRQLIDWLMTRAGWIRENTASRFGSEFADEIIREVNGPGVASDPQSHVLIYTRNLLANVRFWCEHHGLFEYPMWRTEDDDTRELVRADEYLLELLHFLRGQLTAGNTGAEQAILDLIARRGLTPLAYLCEAAWNLREWLREVVADDTLEPVLFSFLPMIRREVELTLLDGELSQFAGDLPNGEKLTPANLVAFIEGLKLPGRARISVPPGKPPLQWTTLARMRALRIAMQLHHQDGTPVYDHKSESDLDAIQRMDRKALAKLWNAIESFDPLNKPGGHQHAVLAPSATKDADEVPKDAITLQEMANLGMVDIKTVRNWGIVGRPTPILPQRGRRAAIFSYTELREWFVKQQPDKESNWPENYKQARATLSKMSK